MKEQIVIDDMHPRTPTGLYPAKAVVGERVPVSADIFKDGHDTLAARVRWRPVGAKSWNSSPLQAGFNDLWSGVLVPAKVGAHDMVVDAWLDAHATWSHKIVTKLEALQDVSVELEEGRLLFAARSQEAKGRPKAKLAEVARMLVDESLDHASRTASATTDEIAALMKGPAASDPVTTSPVQRLWVDRERAGFGSWYCVFPRSWGGLRGLADQLSYFTEMKFDVLYLTPIHPIGNTFRKGKNNTLNPEPDDMGVPYAIGSSDGGHTDIDSSVGTIDDFDMLVEKANGLGLEIALDNALQCSPDHPWVREHLEWFNHRPDGSIAYAENPPKKYQDIYPTNFWPEQEADRAALWSACKDIFTFWIDHGVKIFRVDNPHTKPMAFWSWMIADVQSKYPEVIFLSEAFTRPKVMAKLAEVGFTQSYTYFTWRTTKHELIEYGVEVATGPKTQFMRPNFWPNTHDILVHPLRNAPLGAFKMRLILAATMVPNYGIYSGYELGENEPLSDGNTEYLNSEKYEIKHRNFKAQSSLRPWITRINELRRTHPALQELRNLWFHGSDNDQILAYSKRDVTGRDTVLVVVNLDPYHAQETMLDLNLDALGVAWDRPFEVHDEITKRSFFWWSSRNYVRLEPSEPAHLLTVRV